MANTDPSRRWRQFSLSFLLLLTLVLCDLLWFIVFSWRTARSDALRSDHRSSELQAAAEKYLRRAMGTTQAPRRKQ